MRAGEHAADGFTEAHLVLEASLPAEEISRRLGTQPTTSRLYRNPLKGVEVTERSLALAQGPRAFAVLAEAESLLLARGLDWAAEIGTMVQAPNASAALAIVQRLSDNPDSKGLHLTRELVQWLAIARSEIDLDQYLGKA